MDEGEGAGGGELEASWCVGHGRAEDSEVGGDAILLFLSPRLGVGQADECRLLADAWSAGRIV